jgi:hypothetical protein
MNKSETDKAQFGILTMVDSRGARRDQASNSLCDGLIFDASILLQFKSTLYKAIAAHRIALSAVFGT